MNQPEATVLAAVSAAAIAAAAAIFGTLWTKRRGIADLTEQIAQKEAQIAQLEAAATDSAKLLGQRDVQRWGFKAEVLSVEVSILDFEGTADIRFSYTNVEILTLATLTQISQTFVVESPGAEIEAPVKLSVFGPRSQPFPKAVHLRQNPVSPKEVLAVLEIVGSLTKQDPSLSYALSYRARRSYCMTAEEVAEAYKGSPFKSEYHAISPTFPIDRLELEVRFPLGYPACPCYPAVFLTGTEFIHQQENERIKAGLRDRPGGGVRLVVDQPLLGFAYLIFWSSPSESILKGLTAAVPVP